MANEIVKKEEGQLEVWGTRDYKQVVEKAKDIAGILSNVIQEKNLYTVIEGKKYVHCEGWTLAGAMLGLFPVITEIREEKNPKGVKYIATCEIRTSDGRTIAKGQSECASWEKKRQKRHYEDFEIRSMAQTRAVSKAFRLLLSWIMVFGGYEPTPAEEMEAEVLKNEIIEEQKTEEKPQQKQYTEQDLRKYYIILNGLDIKPDRAKDLIEALYNTRTLKDLSSEQLNELFELVEQFKTKEEFEVYLSTLTKKGEKNE
jgi:hypothetical protein